MEPWIFHTSLYDLTAMASLFAGLTLVLLLACVKKSGQEANLFLSLALGMTALKTGGITSFFLPAVGPLLYFYTGQLIEPFRRIRGKDLLHLSLLLASHWMPIWLVLISIIVYLFLSHRLIEAFYRRLRPVLMDKPHYAFRSLDRALLLIGFFCGLSLFDSIFFIAVAMILIVMASKAILKPDKDAQMETSITDRSNAREKGRRLKEIVVAGRLYEDAELTLTTLAVKLMMHPHDLSRILNVGLEKNFSDFINEFRVREVGRKMQDPAYNRHTLFGIACESGFNSQRTFNRVFKEITGKTPMEYKNGLSKESPNHKLATLLSMQSVILHPVKGNFMFKNYLKTALRNSMRQRLYSLINITGLAVGLAVCMLILLYVAHEHSYDRFHKNAKRIYMITEHEIMQGQEINMEHMSYVSGPMARQTVSAVAAYMRTRTPFKPVIVEDPDKKGVYFSESKMMFADPCFFTFFSFNLLAGSPANVLTKPYSLVISQNVAQKYFSGQNPIGKTLKIKTDSTYTYLITGVAENPPSNSSIDFEFVASNASLPLMKEAQPFLKSQLFQGGAFTVYLLLKQSQDSLQVRQTLQSLLSKSQSGDKDRLLLTAIPDIHLQANFGDASNIKYLKIFPVVAVLILLLALVNYMSLSTARSTLRAKEIGVRKMAGASRQSLAVQFYTESALVTLISFLLGYSLCYFFKDGLLSLLQLKVDASFLYSPVMLSGLLILFLITLLISGSYPAIVLSAFKPVVTLKGKASKQAGGVIIRKLFTTLQFAIAVGLIVCGLIIDAQLYFIRHTDTGINRENVLMVPITNGFGKQYQGFKNEVKAMAAIGEVATAHYPMYQGYDMFFMHDRIRNTDIGMPVFSVDKSFIQTLGISWKIAPASDDMLTNPKNVVINEMAIEKLTLPANPIGKMVDFGGGQRYQIAGVVKDFNFGSLQTTVGPLCIFVAPDNTADWGAAGGCLFAKIKPHTNLPSLIEAIQASYKKYNSATPFSYTFMDDAFNHQYQAEDRLASLFNIFTLITITIAAMGLFGLAAFTIEQRTKEIGIRKILGASVGSINRLLSKDFLKLVVLAFVVASPAAWWCMHQWLQSFAYRINIQWWMFAAGGVLALTVAVITVSYHAIRVAVANPVESLRTE